MKNIKNNIDSQVFMKKNNIIECCLNQFFKEKKLIFLGPFQDCSSPR